jgi:hypothetical protein
VLGSKGGVGKSHVASLVAQYLQERGRPLACIDADVLNETLSDVKALRAEPVRVLNGDGEVDIQALDAMVERFLSEESDFVVDSGSTTFTPLSAHLVTEPVVSALSEAGKRMIVHAVIAGGPEMIHTAKALDAMARQFPAEVRFVLWLNEHHGPVGAFDQTPVYESHRARVIGMVRLQKLHAPTFGANLRQMQEAGLTFAEADKAERFYTMTRQRLRQVWRPITEQIGALL